MKKLAIFALALGLAIAFTVPALAFKIEGAKDQKFYFGGQVVLDLGYWNRSEEFSATGWGGHPHSDRTELILTTPQHNLIKAMFETGNAGAYWEMGLGRDNISAHEQTDAGYTTGFADKTNRGNYLENRKFYGWYNFGNCQILAGKTDGSFLAMAAAQTMGYMENHIYFVGWGVVHDDRTNQVRFTQNFSKAFGYAISLVQPVLYEEGTPGVTSIDSYAKFPRVDAKVSLNFGPVSLFPGGSWQTIKWDNLPNGFDDSLTVWYLQLPVLVKAGPFVGKFQIGYGKNLAAFPLQNAFHKYQRVAGKIKDSTGLTGFFDLAFTAGIATPHLYFGYDRVENNDAYRIGDNFNQRLAYGANVHLKVHDNFFVIPEFTYYDYGKRPNTAGAPEIGKEWISGVQFMFTF